MKSGTPSEMLKNMESGAPFDGLNIWNQVHHLTC